MNCINNQTFIKIILTTGEAKLKFMEAAKFDERPENRWGSIVNKITNLLFLVVCVLMLFSVSWILFDKGAVMVAEDIVSINPPAPW